MKLEAAAVRYIVIHTQGIPGTTWRNQDADAIRRYHVDTLGWKDIGYHAVILDDRHDRYPDGTVQEGRPLDRVGAHVAGLNAQSVGICCVGNGDVRPFTRRQMLALLGVCLDWMERFNVPVERVKGHREVNQLVDRGVLPAKFRTAKTCPGKLVHMDTIRILLALLSTGKIPPSPVRRTA